MPNVYLPPIGPAIPILLSFLRSCGLPRICTWRRNPVLTLSTASRDSSCPGPAHGPDDIRRNALRHSLHLQALAPLDACGIRRRIHAAKRLLPELDRIHGAGRFEPLGHVDGRTDAGEVAPGGHGPDVALNHGAGVDPDAFH